MRSRPAHGQRVETQAREAIRQLGAPCAGVVSGSADEGEWRGELAQRMAAYRVRRRKLARHPEQSHFAFDDAAERTQARSIALAQANVENADEFGFTLAIGRREGNEQKDRRMEIDVSLPVKSTAFEPVPRAKQAPVQQPPRQLSSAYPAASFAERRVAALIDLFCLTFAYGGFLALFSSLGGQFTISKLSAAVCGATVAIVYLQYFALFTIFGGTTPGMMFRRLQVTSLDGDEPSPRQMVLRSVGYMLSAGTFFLGFVWAYWDEDGLTWHDRLSRTYLSVAESFVDEAAKVAPTNG